MTVYLPVIRSEYPWWRKLGIALFNWILWMVPAFSTALDDDLGHEYHMQVTCFTALGLAVPFTAWLLYDPLLQVAGIEDLTRFSTWGYKTIFVLAPYLGVGIFYHLAEECGPYA